MTKTELNRLLNVVKFMFLIKNRTIIYTFENNNRYYIKYNCVNDIPNTIHTWIIDTNIEFKHELTNFINTYWFCS